MNTNKQTEVRSTVEALSTFRALKLALEALEKIGLRGWVERKEEAITAIREALAEKAAQPAELFLHKPSGFTFDSVLAAVDPGSIVSLTPQPAQQNSNCNKTLREQGKAYPRTCKKCGLGPCIADREQPAQPIKQGWDVDTLLNKPKQPAPVAEPHKQQEPIAVVEHWCTYCQGHNPHLCQFNQIKHWPQTYVTNNTSPPAKRKPLTHEQRFDLLTKFEPHKNKWEAPAILIDMVEAAHGIKENT